MAEYNFRDIEEKWQKHWEDDQTFAAFEGSGKPPYYVLDMFPYPSGAGLHVGHPLGYIASDIIARFKRHRGFEVLHPMGYDAFGLPAEQYAIDTGNHPAQFTDANIMRYRSQLKMIGLSYDWSREVKTSDPHYYKWTQWIFTEFFESWYNKKTNKAEPVETLISRFEESGNENISAVCSWTHAFSAEEWKGYTDEVKQMILLNYRLAYIAESEVNWCPALGTVLANEEVKDGLSERGGFPVERRKMRQWFLRITAFADRLIDDLDTIDWPEAVKEMQRNWMGRSTGAEVLFDVAGLPEKKIRIFTTRPDTIFGATFMVLAPEHPLVELITTPGQTSQVNKYVDQARRKSDRERMAETKKVSGVFTGAYAINPFTNQEIPVWIADYVLGDYGTGAIMAVPGHDSRDWTFAKTFGLPVIEVVAGGNVEEAAFDAKTGTLINSGFLEGLQVPQAIDRAIEEIKNKNIGHKQVNYRLRDANFSRQRYWGEPFPIVWRDDIPYPVEKDELPVVLPDVESYKPTGTGESPLAAAKDWVNTPEGRRETNTMPGWAGSSWYYLRYMDPHNREAFVSPEREAFWKNVDFYLGGAEHATGHLLYSRFWHKFLYDRGYVHTVEPFQKLINQGMILGVSAFTFVMGMGPTVSIESTRHGIDSYELPYIYISFPFYNKLINRVENSEGKFLTWFDNLLKIQPAFKNKIRNIDYNLNLRRNVEDHFVKQRVPIEFVNDKDELDINNFKDWLRPRGFDRDLHFFLEDDNKFICLRESEKMSKSKYNVINPEKVIDKHGVDAFRMYEMFLGPIEQSKPWNTEGIDGVSRFLRKFWNLFYDQSGNWQVSGEKPDSTELKILHKAIKKVTEDIERFNLNTCISSFMIAVNELHSKQSYKKDILEPLLILISPFAPHVAEELWQTIGYEKSISRAAWPQWKEEYLAESNFEYPVSINGKVRTKIELPLSLSREEIEKIATQDETVQKWTEGKSIKKIVVVPGRIVNVVV